MNDQLVRAVDNILKPLGFTKTGRVWRRHHAESIDVIGLQKSSYGENVYINLGILFSALERLNNPSPADCHVQVRLNRVHPDPEMVDRVLSGGDFRASTENAAILKWGFIEAEKTFFERFRTLSSASQFVSKHPASEFSILAPLYEHSKTHGARTP